MARLVGVALIATLSGSAFGQERSVPDLKMLAPGQRVTAVSYCRGVYEVALDDGSTRTFKEFDLAFKTDSDALGPDPAKPALVPSGRVGDRGLVIFAELEEHRSFVKARCER